MKKIALLITLIAILTLVGACREIAIDEIETLSVNNLFVAGDTIDLGGLEVTVIYTDGRPEETLDLKEVNFYLRKDNQLIDVERDPKEDDYLKFTLQEGTYSLYVSYGGVSVTITFYVPGDATGIQLVWDGDYPETQPGTFEITDTDTVKEVTLKDARALAWFAKTLNDEDPTILRENGYEGFTVKLEADIDLNGEVWTPIGTVVPFKGSFDGGIYDDTGELIGRHTISNLLLSDERIEVSTYYTFEYNPYVCGTGPVPDCDLDLYSLGRKSVKSGLFHSLGHVGDTVSVRNLDIRLEESQQTLTLLHEDHPRYGYNIGVLAQLANNLTIDNVNVYGTNITINLEVAKIYSTHPPYSLSFSASSGAFGAIIGQISNYFGNIPGSVVISDSTSQEFAIVLNFDPITDDPGSWSVGGGFDFGSIGGKIINQIIDPQTVTGFTVTIGDSVSGGYIVIVDGVREYPSS